MPFEALRFIQDSAAAAAAAAEDPRPFMERAIADARAAAPAEAEAVEREQAAYEARQADRAELLALGDRAAGGAMAEISRAQASATAVRDEIADLEAKLAEKKRKLAREESNIAFWAARMQAVQAGAQRSAPFGHDLLREAKRTMGELMAPPARPAERPPFASRSRGAGQAVRSEARCPRCQLPHERYGMTEAECFLICNDPAPSPVPSVPSEHELEWLAEHQVESRSGQGGPEITRVCTPRGNLPMIYR